jgi:hypothetical protein
MEALAPIQAPDVDGAAEAATAVDIAELAQPQADKKIPETFRLAYGYLRLLSDPSEGPSPANSTASAVDVVHDPDSVSVVPKMSRAPLFTLTNHNLADPIKLFGNQVSRWIAELPNAYQAAKMGNLEYRFVLVENKRNLVTMEISLFKDRHYLFLKRYFKSTNFPRWARGPRGSEESSLTNSEPQDWTPTKSSLCLDPFKDDPEAILDFVLKAIQR